MGLTVPLLNLQANKITFATSSLLSQVTRQSHIRDELGPRVAVVLLSRARVSRRFDLAQLEVQLFLLNPSIQSTIIRV